MPLLCLFAPLLLFATASSASVSQGHAAEHGDDSALLQAPRAGGAARATLSAHCDLADIADVMQQVLRDSAREIRITDARNAARGECTAPIPELSFSDLKDVLKANNCLKNGHVAIADNNVISQIFRVYHDMFVKPGDADKAVGHPMGTDNPATMRQQHQNERGFLPGGCSETNRFCNGDACKVCTPFPITENNWPAIGSSREWADYTSKYKNPRKLSRVRAFNQNAAYGSGGRLATGYQEFTCNDGGVGNMFYQGRCVVDIVNHVVYFGPFHYKGWDAHGRLDNGADTPCASYPGTFKSPWIKITSVPQRLSY